MEERKLYTKEELRELKEWFDAACMPDSLVVNKAVSVPHLKETVDRLFDQAEVCHENPKMQGSIILLEQIKARLEALQE